MGTQPKWVLFINKAHILEGEDLPDTQHDKPLSSLNSVLVGLGIT
jgi:hypothetical protein